MSKERPNACITFTEREKLYDNISHTRFMALVMQPDVDIHEVKADSNSFGEFEANVLEKGKSLQVFNIEGIRIYMDELTPYVVSGT